MKNKYFIGREIENELLAQREDELAESRELEYEMELGYYYDMPGVWDDPRFDYQE